MVDKYSNFKALQKDEVLGSDYEICHEDRTHPIIILAIHGGGIEPFTTAIARCIAGEEYSFYSFIGLKEHCNFETLHINSENFDEPMAEKMLRTGKTVISIHGKKGADKEFVMVGGKNIDFLEEIKKRLDEMKFTIQQPSGNVKGVSYRNVCNRYSEGVQLEISHKLRTKLGSNKKKREKFCEAIRTATGQYLKDNPNNNPRNDEILPNIEMLIDKKVIAVFGAGNPSEREAKLAYEVGRYIALKNAILVCGGLGGCMEQAAKGAKDEGGLTIGIIPIYEKSAANKYIDIVIPTGLGNARNTLVASTADAAIAVGGKTGTLSEIGLARKMGKPVVTLESWEFDGEWENTAGLFKADTPEEAVEIAVREALR